MKVALIAMFLFFSITSCTRSPENVIAETQKVCKNLGFSNISEVNRIISTTTDGQKESFFFPDIQRMVYFRDPRVGLCFAYMRINDYHGGPGMASVPCDAVSQFLLNPATPDCNR